VTVSVDPPPRKTLGGTRIRDLGLAIESTRIEPLVERFRAEIDALGIPIRPRFYLSTEWGVPFGTVAIAIPFYLAREDLAALHRERAGYLEGDADAEVLRYLRHELGHVVSYAYRLYDAKEWVEVFGSITQPYHEEYRPEPFSRRFVRHLPGWYAQKHPDEDWAETFAVWMTPGSDWARDYEGWPALEKLRYTDRTMAELRGKPPIVTDVALEEPVSELGATLDEFYGPSASEHVLPKGIEGALRAVFHDEDRADTAPDARASELLRRMSATLPAEVYRWTGHFPERTRELLLAMARLADRLELDYRRDHDERCRMALTTLVTALAMNHVARGTYLP
jgi:hypothetical protein